MPTWMGNILQTYKVYRDERVRIRNSEMTAECGCMITYNINQLLGLSGLWAANYSARSQLHSRSAVFFQAPHSRSRSAHMLCNCELRQTSSIHVRRSVVPARVNPIKLAIIDPRRPDGLPRMRPAPLTDCASMPSVLLTDPTVTQKLPFLP